MFIYYDYMCYKNICSNKKNGNELIAQIHTELQENNKLID